MSVGWDLFRAPIHFMLGKWRKLKSGPVFFFFFLLWESLYLSFTFFFNRSLLAYNCFTVLLVSVAQQSESAICIHVSISPPSWASLPSSLSHPSRSTQSTKPISLCYAAASHQPTFLHCVVYICRCYTHFAPASPSHPCPQVHPLCLPLYSCPATRFISTLFFFF